MKKDPKANWRPGPETPRAHHIEAAFCDDPGCGLHLVAYTMADKPICEIVMSPDQTVALMDICKPYLYDKAIRRDDE